MSSLPSFSYTAPTVTWFAPDAIARLGSYLRRLGITRAFLVCDAGIRDELAPRVVAAAGEDRVAEVWTEVEADAPVASVERGGVRARDLGADGVVALGGGSAIDSAKAIALLARQGGEVTRWEGANRIDGPGLPLVAIPTTAGTGSEVTSIFVVKDEAAERKRVIIGREVYPSVAVLDPSLTVGLPRHLTAATGADALTHAIEGLVSTFRQPVCEAIGLESVRRIRSALPRAVSDGTDIVARGEMLLAASMAGQLVSLTFSGVAHAVAHALGLGWGIHHGTANAVVLPWSIRFNAKEPKVEPLYRRCAEAFGRGSVGPEGLADAVSSFLAGLGLPTRLGAVGLNGSDLDRLGRLAFADASHRTNPVAIGSADVLTEALVDLL